MSANERTVDNVEATPDDVAALLTARTKDAAGRELGVWTDDTRPTAEQVQERIEIARALVLGPVGEVPDRCRVSAEATVALRAAMLTEAAFWPEQTQSNQSTYERLREMYAEALVGFQGCVGIAGDYSAYDLDIGGACQADRPIDWWQRDLDNLTALQDSLRWPA
jgi:hypothetical protein